MDGFGPVSRPCGGRKKKLDKGLGSLPRLSPGTSARSADSFKGPRSQQKWGQKWQRKEILRSLSRRAYAHKKKLGVNPKKGGLYEPKREIRPLPDAEDESAAGAALSGSGSRSLTGFIENAINFYLDYLSANNAGMFLPSSVQSYLDGRLDQFEDRMASLLYKQSVELDMSMSILADWVHLDEEYLRRKRAESVANVKKLNGRIRLEQLAKRAQERRDSDDGWQD